VEIVNKNATIIDNGTKAIELNHEIIVKHEKLWDFLISESEITKRFNKDLSKMVTSTVTNTTKTEKDVTKERERDSKADTVLEFLRKIYNINITESQKKGGNSVVVK